MHALARTAAALRGLSPYAAFGTDVVPGRDGWFGVDDVPEQLERWIGTVTAFHNDRRLAVSLLGLGLATAAAHTAMTSWVLDRRCPDPSAGNLAVNPDRDGHLAECGVRGPAYATVAAEPVPGLVMPDEDAVAAWWAERAAATLAPLFDLLHTRWRLGRPAAWGAVADELAQAALWVAELAGSDPRDAWREAERFGAALAGHAPVRVVRPRLFVLDGPQRRESHCVRGTCCLYYRSSEMSGPRQDRYCGTCPLLDDPARSVRLNSLTEAG